MANGEVLKPLVAGIAGVALALGANACANGVPANQEVHIIHIDDGAMKVEATTDSDCYAPAQDDLRHTLKLVGRVVFGTIEDGISVGGVKTHVHQYGPRIRATLTDPSTPGVINWAVFAEGPYAQITDEVLEAGYRKTDAQTGEQSQVIVYQNAQTGRVELSARITPKPKNEHTFQASLNTVTTPCSVAEQLPGGPVTTAIQDARLISGSGEVATILSHS